MENKILKNKSSILGALPLFEHALYALQSLPARCRDTLYALQSLPARCRDTLYALQSLPAGCRDTMYALQTLPARCGDTSTGGFSIKYKQFNYERRISYDKVA